MLQGELGERRADLWEDTRGGGREGGDWLRHDLELHTVDYSL